MRAITEQEYARLRVLFDDPPPGSSIAAAKEYGIDLTLLLENLRLTPTERLKKLEAAQHFIVDMRRAMLEAEQK